MKKALHFLIGFFLFSFSFQSNAQLVAGDIVVLGLAADTGTSPLNGIDEFTWMPLVNIPQGTQIYFTDAGWYTNGNSFGALGDGIEFLVRYNAPNLVLAGTVMTVTQASTPAGYTFITGTQCGNSGFVNIPNAGDSITVFQSSATENASFPGTNFTAIFSVTNSTTNWAALTSDRAAQGSNSDNVTNLPPGLSVSGAHIAVGNGGGETDEADNVRYVGTTTTGSKAVILAAVTNYANWARHDAAGNNADLTAGAASGWTANGVSSFVVSGSDNIPPVVNSITLSGSPAANTASMDFVVAFDESVKNVDIGDFNLQTVSGNAAGTIFSVSSSTGTSITVTVNGITGSGSFRLRLNSNTNIQDVQNNGNGTNGFVAAFNSGSVHTVDRVAPTVSISGMTGITNLSSIPITITFSEVMLNFTVGDLTIGNGSASAFGGSGTTYNFNLIPTADGTVTVNIGAGVATDGANNGNTAATQYSVTSDRTPPTVSISGPSGPTNASSIPLTITFNESVTGFVVGDINVGGGSLSGFSVSGTSYSVNLLPSGNGTVSVNIGANGATDTAGNGNSAATQYSIVYDNTQPSTSISSATSSPTNSGSIPVTVTFGESVTGFASNEIIVGNGSVSSFSGSGTTYTFNLIPSGNGTVTVNVGAGVANDAAGNGNTAATQFSIVYDNSQPTVSISSLVSNPTNSSPFAVSVTFSESVSNFVSGDISVGNGTLSNFSGSGSSYSFNLTPTANGTVTVNVAAGVANDTAGNTNTAATQFSRTFDNVQPSVSISSVTTSPTNSGSIPVTITFSESVTGFTSGEITVGNGSVSSFSGSGTTYTFNLIPSAPGTVTVNVGGGVAVDGAGNNNTAATQFSIVYDNTQPSVSISSVTTSPTNSGSIPVTITFSESVTGFIAGEITVGNGTVSSFSGSGTTYTFNLIPSGNGTVTVNVGAGVANDAAGNGNTAATQFSIVYDTAQPTVAITSGQTSPTNVASFSITMTFSENVSNFVSGDVVVGNGSISNFSGSGNLYTATITPTADGTVTVNIAGGVANDTAGNANTAATQFSIVSDKVGPTVVITSSATSPTNLNSIPVTITFSESVTGFIQGDIFISGGSLSGFSGSGSVYTVNVAPSGDGTISVFVFGSVATDSAGNNNSIGTFSIDSDRTRPTVSITSPQSTPTSVNPIVININFSESVTNFVVGDIVATGGTLNGFSGSGSSYTVNLVPSGTGTKTVNVAANTANDAAGNLNFAASQFSIVFVTPCSTPTTWNGLFWTNGEPVASQPAVITGDYSSTGDIAACSLIVGNNAQVIINPGHNVTISGNVNVQAGSTMTFESNANLIQTGSSTTGNVGSIVYKRETSMRRLDYTYWSSPVAGQILKLFSPMTVSPPVGSSRFYTLNEPTNAFVAIANPEATTFTLAKGYNIRAPNDYPTTPISFTGVFTGTPNKGDISIPITLTPGNGFNLIGNPYPSPISADLFLATNPGTLYFWTHFDQGAATNANYASYTNMGFAAAAGGVTPNGVIQAGQGFMLRTNASGNASFTNSMRVANNEGQFFRAANLNDKHRIWINLSSESSPLINQTLVGYMDGATEGIDVSIDGKLIENNGNSISSNINDEGYVIQGRSLPFADTDTVPLLFKAVIAGNYTLSIDHVDGIFAGDQAVFLQDNLTGIVHNIKDSAYTFASETGTFNNRFAVVYQSAPLGIENPALDAKSVVVFKENGVLHINSGTIVMQSVKLFDVRGRLLFERNGIQSSTTSFDTLNAEQQVLILQITANDGKTITKKVIN